MYIWKRRGKQRKWSWSRLLRAGEHGHAEFSRPSLLEWQFPPEDEPWETHTPLANRSTPHQGAGLAHTRRTRAICALLLLTIGVVLYLWRRAEVGAQLLEEELRATIAAEAQLAPPLGSDQDKRVLPSPATILQLQSQGITLADQDERALPSPATTVQARDLTFQGDVVSVRVESTYTGSDGQSYILRERRFYYLAETGWMRLPSHGAYLGPHQVYETEFFTFEYRKMDAAAVEDVATKLDEIYTGMRKDFALPSTTERMVVTLLTDPSEDGSPCYLPYHLCVNSPALASLPATLSESEALQLWILNALVESVHWEALEIQPETFGWDHMMVALSLMQMREHSTLLAAWHTDLMRWFYWAVTRTPKPDEKTLAQELALLCNTHQLRAIGPVFVSIMPVHLCMPAPWLDLHSIAQSKPPHRLGQLVKPYPNQSALTESWFQVLACDMLISYVVATYGSEALPALVEGFRHYPSWDTLAPAVFGVTAEELELGWQEYLQNLY